MVQEPLHIGWGMSISGAKNIVPRFAESYGKAALYFTIPFGLPDAFQQVDCNGISGNVYLAICISEAEHAYFVEHGAEAFEDLLEEKAVDPFNLARPSCI